MIDSNEKWSAGECRMLKMAELAAMQTPSVRTTAAAKALFFHKSFTPKFTS